MKQTTIIAFLVICAFSICAEDKIPFEIKRIQRERDLALKRKTEEINRQYKEALRKQKSIYIKRKDLKSAKMVDSVLATIADDEVKKRNDEERAIIYRKGKSIRFKNGQTGIYLNDSSGYIGSVPSQYKNYYITLINKGTLDPLEFEVREKGTVLLICEKNNVGRLLADGWESTGYATMSSSPQDNIFRELPILKKTLDKGSYSLFFGKSHFGLRLITKKRH